MTLVVARYSRTGVPLAQIRTARALASRGHKVDLIFGIVPDGLSLPDIEGVNIIVLHQNKVRRMLIPLASYLRAEKPDVVLTAEDHQNIMVLLAAIISRSTAKISGSSRVPPFDMYSDRPLTKRWALKYMLRSVMWRADALTCVSKDMVSFYQNTIPNAPHICIYNIVSDAVSHQRMLEHVDHPWLVNKQVPVCLAAGQLETYKGFEYLIQSIRIVRKTRDVRLIILGEGSKRGELQDLIDKLKLSNVVQLQGSVANPLAYFSRADLFALSSLVEGLPNVLVEAMMCGCTPVATDCPTGPREVLNNGEYGYLVPMKDPEAMAVGINSALDHPIDPELLNEAVQPFDEDTVIKQHFASLGL